jgi:Purple acid Phosphatase, N-terminal domain/Calcineurin-like phosphoesterase
MKTLALPFALALSLAAQTGPESPGPARLPDRVILTWATDPASSFSVTWRTSPAASAPVIEWTEADHGPILATQVHRQPAVTEKLTAESSEALYHSGTVTGLAPERLYLYRVGDGTYWSEWHNFRTAARTPKPLKFIYLGDAQNEVLSQWPRVLRLAYQHAPDAAFLIHAGDLINNRSGLPDAEWGEWFRAGGWLYATVPSLPAVGNHEYPARGTGPRLVTPFWRAQFTLPEHGPPGLEESTYFVDIQGVRIVVMDSNERFDEQARWLDGVLSRNPQKWTVLVCHHPIHSSMKGKENLALRASWQPVIDKHKVDLVFNGDEHSYARSGLMTGTVYVVSVGGPKMYEVETRPWMRRSAEDTQFFQIIQVDGDQLHYESRTATGAVYDAFTLRKRGGRNRLIDGPAMPARRRMP